MRTVNELKKLPTSELSIAIEIEVGKTQQEREFEIKAEYLKRHPNTNIVPDFMLDLCEKYAGFYVRACLEILLGVAITQLQAAEAELESMKV